MRSFIRQIKKDSVEKIKKRRARTHTYCKAVKYFFLLLFALLGITFYFSLVYLYLEVFGTDNTVHNMCASAVYMRVRSKYRIKVYFRIVSYSLLACLFMLFSASSFLLFTSSHLDFPGSFSLRHSLFYIFFSCVFYIVISHQRTLYTNARRGEYQNKTLFSAE